MKLDHSDVVWTFVPDKGYRAYRMKSRMPSAERFFYIAALIVMMFLFVILDARQSHAQDQPPVLPDPSKLEDQFDERKLPRSSVTVRRQSDTQSTLTLEDDIRFVLKGIVVQGATVFDPADLQRFYSQYLQKEVSVATLFDIAARISAYYRNNGYILSRVAIPAQEIEDGYVEFVAIEGYINNVSVEGNVFVSKKRLARLGAKIAGSRPLHANDLERYILLANDIPGVTASAVLQASDEPGATDLTIVVSQEKTRLYASANNRGSRFNGPVQGQMGVDIHSLFGGVSRTGLRVAVSAQASEFKLLELSHRQAINDEGTTIQVVGRKTFSEPGAFLRDLSIETESTSGRLTFEHPFIRSRARSLFLHAALDIRDTKTEILGDLFTEDRARVARIGTTYDFIDRFGGISLLNIEVSKGLNVLNATQTGAASLSRADAETTFLKTAAAITRLQRIVPKFSLLFDVAGQYTRDGLLASEEFAIGGNQFGRAFDPSEISGDRGVAGRIELRYDGTTDNSWLSRYQLYAFGDYGIVWNQVADTYQSVDLGSYGAGIRITLNEHVSAYAELAAPYEKTADFNERWGDSVRGFAGISLRF